MALSFIAASLLETFGIGLLGPFISLSTDPTLTSRNHYLNSIYELSPIGNRNVFVAFLGLIGIFIFLLKAFVSWKVQTSVFAFSFQEQAKLRTRLIHSYLSAPYIFHISNNSSLVLNNLLSETNNFTSKVLIQLLTGASNFIVAVSLGVLLSITNPIAICGILFLGIVLLILLRSFKGRIAKWGAETSIASQEIIRSTNHGLGGIKETIVIGCSSYFENQVQEQSERYAKATTSFFAFKLIPRNLVEVLLIVLMVGGVSIALITNRDLSQLTSTLTIFALASIRLIPSISNLAGTLSSLKGATYTVNKLYSDLRNLEVELSKPSLTSNKSALGSLNSNDSKRVHTLHREGFSPNLLVSRLDRIIEIESLSYTYPGSDSSALKGLSLNIKKGESIALIGKSGSGKTTLVDAILGLLEPNKGDIKLDGKSVYSNIRAWQNLIGYIPQSIFLMEDTIERNIAFGVPDDLIDNERLQRAIEASQLSELIEELPEGIYTRVGERGVRLSGGQRQRIGIARALYGDKEILILDEATAALDNETESNVTEAIKALGRQKTMIIIAHRLTTIEHCDKVYVLSHGKIVKSGSYSDIVLNGAYM